MKKKDNFIKLHTNIFINKLFNKLTNDTDECGSDIISVDGAEIVNEEDLIDYFKNTIISNLEYDTSYHLSQQELKDVLIALLSTMTNEENENVISIDDVTGTLGYWLDDNIDSSDIPEDVKDAIANAYVKATTYFENNEEAVSNA